MPGTPQTKCCFLSSASLLRSLSLLFFLLVLAVLYFMYLLLLSNRGTGWVGSEHVQVTKLSDSLPLSHSPRV